jgi:PAS domain S-box-containing protein
MLLHSYGYGFEPYDTFSETFRTELAKQLGQPIEFHNEALESDRQQGEISEELLVQYLNALFGQRPLDLVVPVGGPAVRFAQRHRKELFPGTPMLFSCVEEREVQTALLTTNDTVVSMAFSGPLVLTNILRVLPNTTNVAVVLGDSPLERFWLGEMKPDYQRFTNRCNFVWLNSLPFSEMLKRVADLPLRSVILYVLLSADVEGIPYNQDQALPQLHQVANAPIFGFQDTQLGDGIVGGPLMPIEHLGRCTVKVALRILHGEAPDSIKTEPQRPGIPVYDWRELRRWAIPESRLPAGSTIQFRQPTAWKLFRWYVIGALALFALGATLISMLILNLAKRRRAEERLSLATGAADVGLWMRDVSHDEIWASPNWRRLFGFPMDAKLCYETVIERMHPEDRAAVVRALKHAIDHRTDYTAEYRVALPDGSERWIASRGRLYSEVNSQTQRLGGTSIDITERKLAEAEVLRQREQLAHASRVSIMGELASSIAHELNQPLGAILSNAEAAELLLDQEQPANGNLREILSDIRKDEERASEVIRRMRTLLRRHELERQPLEINLLVEEVLRLVHADGALRRIEITSKLSPRLPSLHGDRVHLQQVFLNLIMNAMDAVAQQPPERRRVMISTSLTTDDAVEVSVTDWGTGIQPHDMSRLFDPFFTTKETGIGMGLAIADKIVTAHYGHIRVENGPAGGATFRVVFPAKKAERRAAEDKSVVGGSR